ncbi:hypothetical protein [Croceibacterium selenioxidans]|uniref:hypothetical protein n=1 Tax=Croceibacterium selenioxidans TaxID=2838833 RepID=UPI002032D868|nr:hypothetical protein [Croceibacterium selenioxidans]
MATTAPAFAGQHQPKPLRFDPAKLDGLSERLIQSHWENNYGGSVKTLNLIETRLAAAVADPDYPPAAYGGLKREELLRTGSVVLHEIYFDGLGGNGQSGGAIQEALTMLTKLLGEFLTREVEAKLEVTDPGLLDALKSTLGDLWKQRCSFAHAHVGANVATQQTFPAPSFVSNQHRLLKNSKPP